MDRVTYWTVARPGTGWVSFMWGDLQGLSKEVAGEWPGKYQEGSGLSRCAHGTF